MFMLAVATGPFGRPWEKCGTDWPVYGLVRVQWEGPWTQPGVPMRARYRYTHWVGGAEQNGERGVFDINAIANGTGWCRFDHWGRDIVPFITDQYKRATGKWHVTHGIEISKLPSPN